MRSAELEKFISIILPGLFKFGFMLCMVLSLFFIHYSLLEASSYAAQDNIFNLAAGGKKGVYYRIGEGIAEAGRKSGIKIRVFDSDGSEENLKWLSDGRVSLCLAQSDIVHNAYRGLGDFSGRIANIRAIGSLYTESVHILIRRPLYIHDIDSFRGKRISMGLEGSETYANARAVLDASGISPDEFRPLNFASEDSIKAIKENNVDIVFITAGFPSEIVRKMIRDQNAYLFNLNSKIRQRLSSAYPFFIITTIPAGTYVYQEDAVITIGVRTLLLCRSDSDKDLIYNLTKDIYGKTGFALKYYPEHIDVKVKTSINGMSVPIAAGAKKFYEEKGLYQGRFYRGVADFLAAILFVMIFVIAIINYRKIKYFFAKKDLAKVFLFLFSILITGSFILYLAEHKVNENYSSIFIALWSGLITMMSLADKEPFTIVGRTTAVAMMTLGVGGVAWFTGEIASIFVQKKMMGGKIKLKKIHDHYVIVNWNSKGYGIIEQLHSDDIRKKKPIIIVNDSTESISFPETAEYESVYLVKGQTTSEAILKRANVHHAHSVIILAEDVMNENSDATSILIILAIRKICIDAKIGKVPIIAEILDPLKIELAVHAGEEGNGNVEIVSPQHMGQRLLGQAAVSPGLTHVYSDLLTFDKDNCEIYRRKVPENFIGESIDAIFKLIANYRDEERNIIPIGIYRDGKSYINPSNSDIGLIKEEDQIYLICYEEKDLGKLDSVGNG